MASRKEGSSCPQPRPLTIRKLEEPSMTIFEISGQKFGRLTAINREKGKWNCLCDCGNTRAVPTFDLLHGRYTSCGCSHKERCASGFNKSHGLSHTKEFRAWFHAKERCFNPKDGAHLRYGARGITMCDRWKNSFENFYADMGPCPSSEHSIDRIENSGNYEPTNCRWATKQEQAINRGRTRWLTHEGVTLCKKDWARRFGVSHGAITYFEKKGWDFSQIAHHFQTPVTG